MKASIIAKSAIVILAIACLVTVSSCSENEPKSYNADHKTDEPAKSVVQSPLEAKIAAGKTQYEATCQACHQANGNGVPGTFPPLAQSDYLTADINRSIGGVVNGLKGSISVNGTTYNGDMPKSTLTDEQIAEVFTYVLNNFGNSGGEVTTEQVAAQRQ